ncbi:calcium-binding protein [Hyphomonas sp.]|uniref:calcium-binding protein n=1 Tax=Hyphomonas sp. TaxID=87 RepID=UPI0025C21D22|nr:calcium-binding protein [Hyphomonas sp.]
MTTLQAISNTDFSVFELPGVESFELYGVQITLSAAQFDGVQISDQVHFNNVVPEYYNEIYVRLGDTHLLDARQWTFTNWTFSATEEAGNHTLIEDSEGDDVIFGSTENDWVLSNGGNDIIRTGAGNDFVGFFFGSGNTTVNGGAGVDYIRLSLQDNTADLTLNLAVGGRDMGNGIKVSGFELMWFYSGSGNDRLTGGSLADEIVGNDGDDVLNGRDGADWLVGGHGADVLIGGAGTDTFTYSDVSDSNRTDGIDRIRSVEADDVIDLYTIDAIDGGEPDAFTYIGDQAFSGAAGELRVYQRGDKWIVAGDTDGDMIADLTIFVTQTATLTEANFLL